MDSTTILVTIALAMIVAAVVVCVYDVLVGSPYCTMARSNPHAAKFRLSEIKSIYRVEPGKWGIVFINGKVREMYYQIANDDGKAVKRVAIIVPKRDYIGLCHFANIVKYQRSEMVTNTTAILADVQRDIEKIKFKTVQEIVESSKITEEVTERLIKEQSK